MLSPFPTLETYLDFQGCGGAAEIGWGCAEALLECLKKFPCLLNSGCKPADSQSNITSLERPGKTAAFATVWEGWSHLTCEEETAARSCAVHRAPWSLASVAFLPLSSLLNAGGSANGARAACILVLWHNRNWSVHIHANFLRQCLAKL